MSLRPFEGARVEWAEGAGGPGTSIAQHALERERSQRSRLLPGGGQARRVSAIAAWRLPNQMLSPHQAAASGAATNEIPVRPSPSQVRRG